MASEDLNNVNIIGRLTRDAESSYTSGGTAMVKFAIAVNKRRKVGDDWITEGHFFDFVGWGRRYEALAQYLTKGTQIAVQASLKQERWEQDGQKRQKVGFDLINVQLIGGRGDSQGSGNGYQQGGRSSAPPRNNQGGQTEGFEDDIPF